MHKWFKDETNIRSIEIGKELDTNGKMKYFLVGKGEANKNARIIYLYLDANIPIESDNVIVLRINGKGDSCAGVYCSNCQFTKDVGCSCIEKVDPNSLNNHHCNHATGDVNISALY